MKQSKVIGITGGVGSGKSTVLDYLLEKYDAKVIQADPLGNEVKLKGHPAYEPLIELLGKDILDDDGQIDKTKMANIIFADEDLRLKADQIIHPEVMKCIQSFIDDNCAAGQRLIIVEAALLIQAGYLPILDGLWVVSSSKEVRIERLMKTRGYSQQKCENIIKSQFSDEDYINEVNRYIKESGRSDFDFRGFLNDGLVNNLYAQLDEAMGDVLNG